MTSLPFFYDSRYFTKSKVSLAIIYSSSVGYTTTFTFESGVEMTAASPGEHRGGFAPPS